MAYPTASVKGFGRHRGPRAGPR